jgi:hypothetical protein
VFYVETSRSLKELLSLGKLEKLVMEYFLKHISAGEIVAILDLKEEVKKRLSLGEQGLVSEPEDAVIVRELYVTLASLIKRGFLVYNNGVYRLSDWIISALKSKLGGLYPGRSKPIEKLVE